MDLRQTLEAGALAACAIAKSDPMEFVTVDANGLVTQPKKQIAKLYSWLDLNFPAGSKTIKIEKDQINETIAHASILFANVQAEASQHLAPFFDTDDDFHIKTDLWRIGKVALTILDLFHGVIQQFPVVKLVPDFTIQFTTLAKQGDALRAEMLATERYQSAMKRAASSASNPL